MRMATAPSAAPSASEPTSPMKMSAGYELYQRNPSDAPTSEPQNTVSSPAPEKCVSSRYSARTRLPTTYARAVYAVAAIVKMLIASPSSPSVRFTAFDSAVRTNAANGTYHQPRSGMTRLKHGNPHVHVGQVGPQHRRHERRRQDQHAAHRRRSRFGTVRLRTLLADHLADLKLAQLADHPRAERQADRQRRQACRGRAKRDVA